MTTAIVQGQDQGFAAFISYAHSDERRAKWLHRSLETYRLPAAVARSLDRDRLGKVFLDRSELATSSNLSDRIAEALSASANLVVICSPAARASRWVNEEVRRFRAMGRGDRIFCLIVDGDPSLADDRGCFPPALVEDLASAAPLEPLAADIRPGKDRPADARLKLIAGLLAAPYDALRRREQARQQRTLAIVATVSLALVAIMSVLTVVAFLSRAEAIRQRDTAEETATFLRRVFDRASPERAAGREVTVREIVRAAQADALSSSDLARQPEVKASLLTTLAGVSTRLRLVGDGRRLIEAARALPVKDRLTMSRMEVVDANLRLLEGDYAGLRQTLARGFALLEDNSDLSANYYPQLLNYRAQLAQAENQPDAAMRDYAELRRISLAATPPDRDNVILASLGEGVTAVANGDLDRAQPLLTEVITRRTAMGQPLDPDVLTAINTLGAVAAKRGDMVNAERLFRRAIVQQSRIYGPESLDVALSRNNLGRALVEQRRFDEALAELRPARAAFLRQVGDRVDTLAHLEDSLGLALGGIGSNEAARAAFDRGLAVARANQMPKEVELLTDRAELECRHGDARVGAALVDQAFAVLERFALPEPWRRARIQAVQGTCLLSAGRNETARIKIVTALPLIIDRWGSMSLFGRNARSDARRADAQ